MPVFKLSKKPTQEEPKEGIVTDEVSGDDNSIVVLDGPLSKIYTEALNKVYAIESYMTDGSISEGKSDKEEMDKTYLYAVDAKDLDMKGTNETFHNLRLALDSEDYDEVMLSIENVSCVSESIAIIDEYAKRTGVKVVYRRDVAIGALK